MISLFSFSLAILRQAISCFLRLKLRLTQPEIYISKFRGRSSRLLLAICKPIHTFHTHFPEKLTFADGCLLIPILRLFLASAAKLSTSISGTVRKCERNEPSVYKAFKRRSMLMMQRYTRKLRCVIFQTSSWLQYDCIDDKLNYTSVAAASAVLGGRFRTQR